MNVLLIGSDKDKFIDNPMIQEIEKEHTIVYPSWYSKCSESSFFLKKDVHDLNTVNCIVIVDSVLSAYTLVVLYEATKLGIPIFCLGKIKGMKNVESMLGLKYKKLEDVSELPYSKFASVDIEIQEIKGISSDVKEEARKILNDFEYMPNFRVIDKRIMFVWESDPSEIDHCKYCVEFTANGDGLYSLKMTYYNEVVRDVCNSNYDDDIYKLNKFIRDMEHIIY